jgi:hypothetical protein
LHQQARAGRRGDFYTERDEHFEGERTLDDVVLERGALQEFHGDESLAVFFADVVNRADIRVIERGGGLRFALKASERAGIGADIFRKKFQSDVATEARVFGSVNDSHAAAAEAFKNAIVRKALADELVGAGHERGHVRWPLR